MDVTRALLLDGTLPSAQDGPMSLRAAARFAALSPRRQILVHDLLRGPVTERRMKTSLIIAKLDPSRNIIHGRLAGRVHFPVHQLGLQGPVPRFRYCIVEADPGAADRLRYA